jgi:F0F1-type ATP synthase assembly protein I
MKNMAVLKKFVEYLVLVSLVVLGCYTISYQTEKMFGHAEYGMIGIIAMFMIAFIFVMAKEQVERQEREKQRLEREAEYQKSRKTMLME